MGKPGTKIVAVKAEPCPYCIKMMPTFFKSWHHFLLPHISQGLSRIDDGSIKTYFIDTIFKIQENRPLVSPAVHLDSDYSFGAIYTYHLSIF